MCAIESRLFTYLGAEYRYFRLKDGKLSGQIVLC